MFTLFQTFSAADLHWDDFHKTFPESEKYLGKRLVSQSDFDDLSESDKARAITKQEDYRLRMKALNDNPDKVDSYFSERLQVLLKHVMPILGALYWIIRFEVQARGTIHAHLLIGVKGGPSKHDLEKARTKNGAYQKCTDDEKREIYECRDNVLTCSCANLEAVDANMLQDNVASVYWNRDTDSNYQVAVKSFREGQASEDPATVSLFKFASKYTTRWKLRGEERVPHVTPNFRQIPNKHVSKMHDRYVLYLKTLLLVYKAGTKLSDYTKLGKDDLELEVKTFVQTSECPRLILEEFQESQIFQESKNVLEREIDSDVCDDDLHIEPIIPQETYPQEP
ncbi:hypothetical protein ACOMHN_035431 [Nucella lapillus]